MAWFRFVTRRPWPVLAGALLACLASIAPVTGLRIDNAPESWLLKGDPGLAAYREYKEEFATDEYVVVGYDAPAGVLSSDALAMVERVTARFEKLDGVMRVTSIANVEEMRANGDALEVGDLVQPPLDENQRRRILYTLTTDPLFAGSLAGADGRSGAIVIKCEAMQDGDRNRRFRLLDEIRAATAGERFSFYPSGAVAFDAALFKAMVRDQNVLTPLMLAVFVVVLGFLFRAPSGVLLPSCTVATAVLWTFALVGLSGHTVNVVMSMLTVVLLAIGVADSVHFLTEYQEERTRGRGRDDAIIGAGSTVFTPCLFTSVTTALGFLGLLLIRVAPLREFGVFAAVGTMLAFCATMTIVPAALRVLPDTRRAGANSRPSQGEGLRRLFAVVTRYRVAVVMGSTAFMAMGIAGMPRVTTSANWYEYLADDHPTRLATDFIEQRIGGVYTLEMLVAPPDGYDGLNRCESRRFSTPSRPCRTKSSSTSTPKECSRRSTSSRP
ncbi:MAG: RND family transporter [Candidatus Binatia bacterium]